MNEVPNFPSRSRGVIFIIAYINTHALPEEAELPYTVLPFQAKVIASIALRKPMACGYGNNVLPGELFHPKHRFFAGEPRLLLIKTQVIKL